MPVYCKPPIFSGTFPGVILQLKEQKFYIACFQEIVVTKFFPAIKLPCNEREINLLVD
jgi:hypothetical protein